MKINQKGFSAVESLLLFVVLAIIVGTGYFVFNSQKQANATLDAANATASSSSVPTKKKIVAKTPKQLTFKSTLSSTTFKYPETWKLSGGVTDGVSGNRDEYKLTSADGKVVLTWENGIGGLGGACDDTVPVTTKNADLGPCPEFTVVSKEPLKSTTGLYVVSGVVTSDGATFVPWLAVENKDGVVESMRSMGYDVFTLPSQTTNDGGSIFTTGSVSIGNGDNKFTSLAAAKAYLSSPTMAEAQQILSSLSF
ncbi:MAG: hypothetical protein JWO41_563 [Candidatus Saccharibacteria bacterium]|nr:hypothetical protein [Candidatus Saccharibacteria bacterium]